MTFVSNNIIFYDFYVIETNSRDMTISFGYCPARFHHTSYFSLSILSDFYCPTQSLFIYLDFFIFISFLLPSICDFIVFILHDRPLHLQDDVFKPPTSKTGYRSWKYKQVKMKLSYSPLDHFIHQVSLPNRHIIFHPTIYDFVL